MSQQKQKTLPFDKQNYARVMIAIENVECDELTLGQLRIVRRFLKEWFVGQYSDGSHISSPDGTGTFRRRRLATHFCVCERAMDNRLKWAVMTGVVEKKSDCDEDGKKRTTMSFAYSKLLSYPQSYPQDQSASSARPKRIEGRTKAHRVHDQSASKVGPKRIGCALPYIGSRATIVQEEQHTRSSRRAGEEEDQKNFLEKNSPPDPASPSAAVRRDMTIEPLRDRVAELLARIGYRSGCCQTVWIVAAIEAAGELSEAEVSSAAEGARMLAGNPVAYFRSCLEETLARRGTSISGLIRTARVQVGMLPNRPPAARSSLVPIDVDVTVPREPSEAEARERLMATLRALERESSERARPP